MNIKILEFSIDQYDDVFALWRHSEGVELSGADEKKHIQAYLQRNPGMSFVAVADGAVAGSVLCGHDGRRGYIHHLAVRADCRRKGIGRRLATACLDVLSAAGIQKCHLFIVNQNEKGRAFWESIGWTVRGDIGVISKNIARPKAELVIDKPI